MKSSLYRCLGTRLISLIAGILAVPAVASAQPAVGIEKLVNDAEADSPPGPTVTVGDALNFTYVVSNLGDSRLDFIEVDDDDGLTVFCPETSLGFADSMVCSAFGTAREGLHRNVGTVSASSGKAGVFASDVAYYTGEPDGGNGNGGEGDQGCTPGYWKVPQHHDSWAVTGYTTAQLVQTVFSEASAYSGVGTATLLEALDFGGGPTVTDAARILIRAAVAAVLNATHPDVDYPRAEASVIAEVNAALATGDRDTILDVKDGLDADNNLGCPLN